MAMQEDIFITKLHINNVRHLKDIEIPISETERKHLILTGKNGSGKTSVLEAIHDYLLSIENNEYSQFHNWLMAIQMIGERIDKVKRRIKGLDKYDFDEKFKLEEVIKNSKSDIESYERKLNQYFEKIQVNFNHQKLNIVQSAYNNGNFIILNFGARRSFLPEEIRGIETVKLKGNYKSNERVNKAISKYLVSLNAGRLFAKEDGDESLVKTIDNWFQNFENALKSIFEDDTISLYFKRDNFNFNFYFENAKGQIFDFNTLSDGFSSFLGILTELIMRTEGTSLGNYNLQGIVLIDEIETHLHISLQKKILPFLTSFFPKIQFIVTTHSPFVLNSIKNAVIYDLENEIRVEDLTGYSYDGLVESYFMSDKYSDELKQKVTRYETLLKQKEYKNGDFEELFKLKVYFDKLPTFMAPELSVKLKQLESLKAQLHD